MAQPGAFGGRNDDVPDTRKHRGPHPEDARLFADAMLPRLRAAVADLSWLLTPACAA